MRDHTTHKVIHQAEVQLSNTNKQVIIREKEKLGKSSNGVKLNINLLRRPQLRSLWKV